MSSPSNQIAVEMAGVSRNFGRVQANTDVDFRVMTGEIHALVGENGAGKSTLMHILSGLLTPSSGKVTVFGKDVTGWNTGSAIAAGVGMVHQHFMLVPTLTVAENLVLGSEPVDGLRFDRKKAEDETRRLSIESGLTTKPDTTVEELSVGEAQRVEILKVLYRGAKLLILDEPTAVLSPPEVEELWTVLRRLKAKGDTIIIITHKLDEVVAISDTVTVMRAGRSIASFPASSTTPAMLAREMVGRDVNISEARTSLSLPAEQSAPETKPALSLNNVSIRNDRKMFAVRNVSFHIKPGEILGIAGVEGNGQTELLEAIAGLRVTEEGSMAIGSVDLSSLGARQRSDAGLSHIPEDRHRRGLILDWSVSENLIFGQQHLFSGRSGIDGERIRKHAVSRIAEYDIRPPDPDQAARTLSGGNQQKIVIAREMGREYSVLLAAQPTRGVDVGAIEFIHSRIRQARDSGKAILLVSADLSEVLALADRIAVMYGGQLVCMLPAHDCSSELLGPWMTGAGQ